MTSFRSRWSADNRLTRYSHVTMCKIVRRYCDICQTTHGASIKTCSLSATGWLCTNKTTSKPAYLETRMSRDKRVYVYLPAIMYDESIVTRCEDCIKPVKRAKTTRKPRLRNLFFM